MTCTMNPKKDKCFSRACPVYTAAITGYGFLA